MKQLLAVLVATFVAAAATAQTAWVQVEAHPTLAEGRAAAALYARAFDAVQGYRLTSGWYAVALGPLEAAEAGAELRRLRVAGAVPRDSFVADGARFREPFWPAGAIAVAPLDPPGAEGPETAALAAPRPAATPATAADEMVAEARRGEQALSLEERQLLQVALRWEGVYGATIDGAFGPGTRRAIAEWQRLQGAEPTGVLTAAERAALLRAYRSVFDGLAMARVHDTAAGIAVEMPTAKVRFARQVPPFAEYAPADADGVRVILLSREGNRGTLAALFDVLQTLEAMPPDGPRERRETSFSITGAGPDTVAQAEAWLVDGAVKGFVLVWPAGDERRRERVLEAMLGSFEALPGALAGGGLPGPPRATGPAELGGPAAELTAERTGERTAERTAGLEVRRPERARTGFFVDRAGHVLTAAEAVEGCGRITLDGGVEARVVAADAGLGLALLAPAAPLAPMAVARFGAGAPDRDAEVAVAGFAYEGRLGAPTLSFGAVAERRGLDGDARVHRLALAQVPGEAGGPVLDAGGAVVGLLLPPHAGARRLPEGVSFAANGAALAAFLVAHGVTPEEADRDAPLGAEDLTALGAEMSVLVACWN